MRLCLRRRASSILASTAKVFMKEYRHNKKEAMYVKNTLKLFILTLLTSTRQKSMDCVWYKWRIKKIVETRERVKAKQLRKKLGKEKKRALLMTGIG